MKIQCITNSINFLNNKKKTKHLSSRQNSAGAYRSNNFANNIPFMGKNVIVQSYKPKNLEVLFSEKEIQNRIKTLANEINNFYKQEPVTIVTVMKGALPFAMDLSKQLNMPVLMEFIQLSSRDNSRISTDKIKEINMTLPNLDNQNVLIVEDIVSTGLTGKYVIDSIKSHFKPKTLKFCTFIDEQASRKYNFKPDFTGFTVKNDKRFVIGYGLDDNGYCRNLPFVGYDEPLIKNSV